MFRYLKVTLGIAAALVCVTAAAQDKVVIKPTKNAAQAAVKVKSSAATSSKKAVQPVKKDKAVSVQKKSEVQKNPTSQKKSAVTSQTTAPSKAKPTSPVQNKPQPMVAPVTPPKAPLKPTVKEAVQPTAVPQVNLKEKPAVAEVVAVVEKDTTTSPSVTPAPATDAPTVAPVSIPVVPVIEPIYTINQRFAKVPLEHCPLLSKGYGFEVSYPADKTAYPVISKVYGNAFLAGLKEGAQLITINGQAVHTQSEFNTIAYQGRAREMSNLIASMTLGVIQNGAAQNFEIKKGDYCLSNLAVESERNILRMDFSTKGTGYSAKADARVYVDAAFLSSLDESDWLTIAAVAAGEQYRNQLRVKRGKTGLFLGQVFGTVVTLFTGLPITDITASSANAVGAKDRGEGALRPAMSYGYYLGLPPADMRASLEKLVSFREGYKVQGKRYDWPIPDDLTEFEVAQVELAKRVASNEKNVMLDPKTSTAKTDDAKAKQKIITPPPSESKAGVGVY